MRLGWSVAAAACAGLALAGCAHRRRPPPPAPTVRYMVEPSWQVGEVWFYPHETFTFDATGLATVLGADHAPLTTDNETYDPGAMAAAMQAVQLPAIATVTDLQTGRAVDVRVNDRGPADPGRLIALTPRVAALLGMTGPAQVRVRFDPVRSAALAHQVQGHAGDLAIVTAPRGDVQQTQLAPLAGSGQEAGRFAGRGVTVAQAGEAQDVVVPLRLAEQVMQAAVAPGALMIDAGVFTHEDAARRRVRAAADVDVRLERSRTGGVTSFAVRAGPFSDLAGADAALRRMREDGVSDARIVVDAR